MIENQANALAALLGERTHQYYPELGLGKVGVILLKLRLRRNSTLYRFELRGEGLRRVVLVKVPSIRGDGDARPYVVPETDPAIKFRFHHAALAAMHAHFKGLNDPRFGTIRALDIFPEFGAFAMEEAPFPTLYSQFRKTSRLRLSWGASGVDQAIHHAGAWLRAFHALPNHEEAQVVHAQRSDFMALINTFADFLARAIGNEAYFGGIASKVTAKALEALPDSLPLGLRFGDFGLTNVLVAPRSQVIGFDTLAAWRTSIYEDLAYFLTGLQTTWLQIATQGLAYGPRRMARCEQLFLSGYFERAPIPFAAIRLYEILKLMERWSAKWIKIGRSRATHPILSGMKLALVNAHFRRKMSELLRAAEPSAREAVYEFAN